MTPDLPEIPPDPAEPYVPARGCKGCGSIYEGRGIKGHCSQECYDLTWLRERDTHDGFSPLKDVTVGVRKLLRWSRKKAKEKALAEGGAKDS